MADPMTASKVRSRYPHLAWILDIQDPAIQDAILNIDSLSAEEFAAKIYNSNYYRTNAASIREATAQRNVDPATWASRRAEMRLQVQNLAMSMGMNDPAVIDRITDAALTNGWSDAMIRQTIAADSSYGVGDSPGSLYTTTNDIVALADAWGVPMSDQTAFEWSKRIAAGSMTLEGMLPYFQEQAKSMFPAISAAIDAGVDVRTYYAPYLEIAAQELGINPSDIRLSDPKWNRALMQTDPKTGARMAMSLNEWTQTLRTDPIYGWDQTAAARDQAAQFATRALNRLGFT